MAIYVDGLNPCLKSIRWPYAEACHLVADDIDELHAFAESIGLKRRWFQPTSMPHYDMVGRKRAEAVKKGAVEIGREKLVELLRKQRVKY